MRRLGRQKPSEGPGYESAGIPLYPHQYFRGSGVVHPAGRCFSSVRASPVDTEIRADRADEIVAVFVAADAAIPPVQANSCKQEVGRQPASSTRERAVFSFSTAS